MNIDEKIETLFQPISELITSIIFGSFSAFETNIPFIVVWLVFASLFFTFYFNFVNLRFFKRAVMVARGKFDKPSDPGDPLLPAFDFEKEKVLSKVGPPLFIMIGIVRVPASTVEDIAVISIKASTAGELPVVVVLKVSAFDGDCTIVPNEYVLSAGLAEESK